MSTKINENIINPKNSEGFLDSSHPALLDTLAQLAPIPLNGHQERLKKRVIRKYLTNEIVFALIETDSPLHQSYWNSYHCAQKYLQEGKTLTSHYCNNRWCMVCNGIRTAKLIKGYLPVLKEMKSPQFVTLTIPNMPGEELSQAVDLMQDRLTSIRKHMDKYDKCPIRGIRKLEITYNFTEETYHPHYHFVVDGRETADLLVSHWLENFTEAVSWAQDIRPADEGSMIELFKYTTKIVTKGDKEVKGDVTTFKVCAKALDVIFRALVRKRAFQPMGLTKVVSEDVDDIQSEEYSHLTPAVQIWEFVHDVGDYVNESGEFLTGSCVRNHYKVLRR